MMHESKFLSVCELFRNQARKTPNAIAAIFENTHLTYLELDQRSDRLANSLKRAGVEPETLVGLSLSQGFDILVGLLGIVKSGGVYLPLDPNYQKERIRYILDDAKPKILITESAWLHHFEGCSCRIMQMSEIDFAFDAFLEPVEFKPKQLAYVIYTSGSTGKPKGIMVEHESFAHAALAHTGFYPEKTVALLSSGISFDPSLLIIFHTLASGGTICIPNREESIDAEKGIDLIERHSINYLLCVPSFYAMLLNKARLMPSLRCVSLAGEAVPNSLPAEHARLAPNAFLYNEYGPTEYAIGTTIGTIVDPVLKKIHEITVGKPLPNTKVLILDENQQPVNEGDKGEIFISGIGLARGYLNKPELTEEKFVRSAYKTGDFGRFLPDGRIEFLGRMDRQVKIRGYRIELSEIEHAIRQCPGVNEAVVIGWEDRQEAQRLIAYFSTLEPKIDFTPSLKAYLANQLPKPMMPSAFIQTDKWPRTPNGKIDTTALSADCARITMTLEAPPPKKEFQSLNEIEQSILAIWKEVLQRNDCGVHDNFFELGGDSLQVAVVQTLLRDRLDRRLGMTKLFEFPTVSLLAHYLSSLDLEISPSIKEETISKTKPRKNSIAVIGLSARFPGAPNVQAFWENLCQGNETISTFLSDPRYVNRRGTLTDVEMFDAEFFGMSPKEVEVTDPQHRVFLECAWEALEMAGYCPDHYAGSIGVYGGASRSSYFLHNLFLNEKLMQTLGDYQIRIGNENDFLTTRVSYKLNLKGPSLSIQTACSTSLVAICVACNHLLTHQCDLALAGGVSIFVPQETGYIYQQDMIFSPDGHCRPFDASAEGTVPSNGAGVVALKRLEDAERDGDTIYAVIRGYGMNNDGNEKMGYTAPSVQGQKKAIESAIAMAEIDPATINYIETHGTGTILGDPVEIEALTQAFRKQTQKQQFCAIGSVKGNIGHTMEAAGVAGFIKAVLALHYKRWPASLHFSHPNPNIDFHNSPFYVQSAVQEWTTSEIARRAGVSSFGFGGTNAHVILEEAMKSAVSPPSANDQLLILSAKTPAALKQMALNLAHHLQQNPTLSLADVAYTLQMGRKEFKVRQAFVCSDLQQAIESLFTFREQASNNEFLRSLGQHWMQGGHCDWTALHPEKRYRLALPTYPFEKKRYWVDSLVHKKSAYVHSDSQSIETSLIEIWRDCLGRESFSIHDDFFQLGGDSLMAIQVIAQVHEHLGIRLSTQALLEHRTIAKLSQLISVQKPPISSVVQLKSGSCGSPLFFIHPIEGTLFCYRDLVDRLTCPNPLYGLQAVETENNHIEEIASRYLEDLKKIQPTGPYRLFGTSFGGIIAYEMARQLKIKKETVALLCMVDAVKPDPSFLPLSHEEAMLTHLMELFEGKPVRSKELSSEQFIRSLKLDKIPHEEQQILFKRIKNHLQALMYYQPKSYYGNILFFQAKERFFRLQDLCLGSTWKDLVSGTIEIKEISGNHLNMMRSPNVQSIAYILDNHLQKN